MAQTKISTLKAGDPGNPIEIKVIRKWIPYGHQSQYCFLFLDKHGMAIEAVADLRDRTYFDGIIRLQSCYVLTNYICQVGRPFFKIVPHPTIIRLGRTATFTLIPDNGFPLHYFNFVTYDNLHHRVNNNEILTDYIGIYHSTTGTLIRKDKTLLKIKLQDLSDNFIDATLWEEIVTSFDEHSLTRTPTTTIALTSMKVNECEGSLQLSSTSATYIYINPDINLAKSMTTTFEQNELQIPIPIGTQITPNTNMTETEKNRQTISELLEKDITRENQKRFTCIASITNIEERRGWYYKGCTQCRKKVHPSGETLACQDHGQIDEPRHFYCFTATITDNTASTSATFFDDAVTSLIETECTEMVVKLGHTDPNILPEPLQSIQ